MHKIGQILYPCLVPLGISLPCQLPHRLSVTPFFHHIMVLPLKVKGAKCDVEKQAIVVSGFQETNRQLKVMADSPKTSNLISILNLYRSAHNKPNTKQIQAAPFLFVSFQNGACDFLSEQGYSIQTLIAARHTPNSHESNPAPNLHAKLQDCQMWNINRPFWIRSLLLPHVAQRRQLKNPCRKAIWRRVLFCDPDANIFTFHRFFLY